MKPQPSKITSAIQSIRTTLHPGVELVAVSKFHPASSVIEAYEAGQRIFGESRVQELQEKYQELRDRYPDIRWHFIGPLQTNKVKYIAPYISLIESITSERLLDEVNKQAIKLGRRISVLLEVYVAQEKTKTGFSVEEVLDILRRNQVSPTQYAGIEFRGLMAMASFTDDQEQIRREFSLVKELQVDIIRAGLVKESEFNILSMGMSGDYLIAMECGSTSVRIGSAIFGDRVY